MATRGAQGREARKIESQERSAADCISDWLQPGLLLTPGWGHRDERNLYRRRGGDRG